MKGKMVQIIRLLKAQNDKSTLCSLSSRFRQMLALFANNSDQDVRFMDDCLNGLATALSDNRCNQLLEARLFAFGSTGKPLPVYQLRTSVLNRRASPF